MKFAPLLPPLIYPVALSLSHTHTCAFVCACVFDKGAQALCSLKSSLSHTNTRTHTHTLPLPSLTYCLCLCLKRAQLKVKYLSYVKKCHQCGLRFHLSLHLLFSLYLCLSLSLLTTGTQGAINHLYSDSEQSQCQLPLFLDPHLTWPGLPRAASGCQLVELN